MLLEGRCRVGRAHQAIALRLQWWARPTLRLVIPDKTINDHKKETR